MTTAGNLPTPIRKTIAGDAVFGGWMNWLPLYRTGLLISMKIADWNSVCVTGVKTLVYTQFVFLRAQGEHYVRCEMVCAHRADVAVLYREFGIR
jgi:hypothetical protein